MIILSESIMKNGMAQVEYVKEKEIIVDYNEILTCEKCY